VVRRSLSRRHVRQFERERYGGPPGNAAPFARESALGDWEAGAPERIQVPSQHAAEALERNARTHLIPLLEAHIEVDFWVYLPPHSVLAWADNARKGVLEDALQFRSFLFRSTQGLANVRVFDFQAEQSLVLDLDQYRDVLHHSPAVSARILRLMAAGEHRLTAPRLEAAQDQLRVLASMGPGAFPGDGGVLRETAEFGT